MNRSFNPAVRDLKNIGKMHCYSTICPANDGSELRPTSKVNWSIPVLTLLLHWLTEIYLQPDRLVSYLGCINRLITKITNYTIFQATHFGNCLCTSTLVEHPMGHLALYQLLVQCIFFSHFHIYLYSLLGLSLHSCPVLIQWLYVCPMHLFTNHFRVSFKICLSLFSRIFIQIKFIRSSYPDFIEMLQLTFDFFFLFLGSHSHL